MNLKKTAVAIGLCWCLVMPAQAQQIVLSEQKALIALTHQGFDVKQIKSAQQEGRAVFLVQATRQGKRYELVLALPSLRVIEQKIHR